MSQSFLERIRTQFSKSVKRFKPWQAVYFLAVLSITIGVVARFAHLGRPTAQVFDEVYFPVFASKLLHGVLAFDVHPPFGKMLLAVGIVWLGDNSIGWRIIPALFGCGIIALFAYAWLQLRPKQWLGALVVITLVSTEGILITYSRTGLMDGVLLFAILGCYTLALRVKNLPQTLLLAILLGITTAIKWIGLGALAPVAYILWRRGRFPYFPYLVGLAALAAVLFKLGPLHHLLDVMQSSAPWIQWVIAMLMAALLVLAQVKRSDDFLAAIPLGILAYLAIIFLGEYIGGVRGFASLWKAALDWHSQVWYYQTHLDATHPWSSSWWTWPLMLRPVLFYYQSVPGQGDPVQLITSLGNPLVWLPATTAVVASVWVLVRKVIQRVSILDHPLVPVVIGYFAFLVPWIGVSRVAFNYHYLPSYGFALLALTYCVVYVWKRSPKLVITYLVVVLLSAIYFLPFSTGNTVSQTWPTAALGIDQGDHIILGHMFHLDGWRDSHFWLRSDSYQVPSGVCSALGTYSKGLCRPVKLGWL